MKRTRKGQILITLLSLMLGCGSTNVLATNATSDTTSGAQKCSFLMGVDFLENLQPDKAIHCFTKSFLSSKPTARGFRAKALLMIGRAFEADENDVAALDAIKIANALNPNDQTIVAYLVEALLRCGYFEQSKPYVAWLESQKEKNRAVIEILSIVAMRQYDPAKATALLESEAIKPDGKSDTHLLLMYARALTRLGLSDDSKREFQAAADAAQNEYTKNMASATVQRIAGHTDEQKKFILAAGKIHPDEPTWHLELGDMYANQGKNNSAVNQFNLAMQNRTSARVYVRTIGFLRRQKRYDDALKVAQYFAKLKPRSFEPFQQFGNVYLAKNDNTNAEINYRKALSIDNHIDSIYGDLARCKTAEKDHDGTGAILRDGLAVCPNSITLLKRLATFEKDSGNETEARKLFQRLISLTSKNLDKSNVIVKNDTGWAYANLGCFDYFKSNYDQALQNAQKFNALKFVPTLPPLLSLMHLRPGHVGLGTTHDEQEYAHHIMLADMLREGGKLDECIAEYRKAEALNSDDPDLHSYLLSALDAKGDMVGAAKEDIALSSRIVNRVPAQIKALTEKKKTPPTPAPNAETDAR